MKKNPTVTGYQWGEGFRYIGPYTFEKNGDQEAIHMPPNTTLIEPPEVPPGKYAVWMEAREQWVLHDIPMPIPRPSDGPAPREVQDGN